MQRFFSKVSVRGSEGGAFFPLAFLIFSALLAVAGLAIDAGNMFLTQLYLQRAVDAGVISAMLDSSNSDDDTLRAATTSFIIANMRASGIYHPDATDSRPASSITVNVDRGQINANADTPAQTFILHALLPELASYEVVNARAGGGGRRVAVVLVLDESGSMKASQECSVSNACRMSNGRCTKACLLKQAAKSFIADLDDTDFIGVVGFNSISTSGSGSSFVAGSRALQPLVPCSDLPGESRCKDQTINNPITGQDGIIDQLTSNGGTCISCGLSLARGLFNNANLDPSVARYVVLMSDGAPTHSPHDRPAPNPNNGSHHCGYAAISAASSATCYYTAERDSSGRRTYTIIPECAQRHAYAAIVQSDLLRSMNIPVLGVGLGASGENWCMEEGDRVPFQTCSERAETHLLPEDQIQFRTRPYLFRRLTNTVRLTNNLLGPADPAFEPIGYQEHSLCIPRYGPSFPPGEYFETPDATYLSNLFKALFQIIKRPRLRT